MTAIKERKSKKTVETNSDENTLAMYLREIGRIPLLTRAEEDEAARAAAKGNGKARDKLVNGNLRFVVNIAKKYQGKGLPLQDLISEGNIGLLNAVDRFDAERGYHFISYAVWWIRQAVLKAITEKARMIRLPQNRANELFQIEKARRVVQEQGNPGDEIQDIAKLLEMEPEAVEDLLNLSRDMVSLESPVYAGDTSVLGDHIEDEQYTSPDQEALRSILEDDIEKILNTLDEKEADIIRFRYGLGSQPAMSLKEIGDHFNLTKERIRQIEKKAILRLQHPSRKSLLAAYVA
jgi:RNA polymerase primary sigma factor